MPLKRSSPQSKTKSNGGKTAPPDLSSHSAECFFIRHSQAFFPNHLQKQTAFSQKADTLQTTAVCPLCFTLRLFELKCAGIELIVLSFLLQQPLMAAAFNDAAVVKDHNHIGILDG